MFIFSVHQFVFVSGNDIKFFGANIPISCLLLPSSPIAHPAPPIPLLPKSAKSEIY